MYYSAVFLFFFKLSILFSALLNIVSAGIIRSLMQCYI